MPVPDDRELDHLFASYRDALPDMEPSAEFMPLLWQAIEARQNVTLNWRRLASAFASAALAICLVLTLAAYSIRSHVSPVYESTYVEALALAEDDPGESLVFVPVNAVGEVQ